MSRRHSVYASQPCICVACLNRQFWIQVALGVTPGTITAPSSSNQRPASGPENGASDAPGSAGIMALQTIAPHPRLPRVIQQCIHPGGYLQYALHCVLKVKDSQMQRVTSHLMLRAVQTNTQSSAPGSSAMLPAGAQGQPSRAQLTAGMGARV